MTAADRRVRVKICGVTRPEDAELAVALGADFIGVNFWPGSSRCLEPSAALEVAAAADGATLVGVFVNEESGRVEEIAAQVGLALVQLHGDEGPDEVAAFGSRALKAVRFYHAPEPDLLSGYPNAWGFLIEARAAGAYGGAGRGWDYNAARALDGPALARRPLLIAGGLGPENVGRAIVASAAWGVDVASGVESEPGIKDPSKLEMFFAETRHAAR